MPRVFIVNFECRQGEPSVNTTDNVGEGRRIGGDSEGVGLEKFCNGCVADGGAREGTAVGTSSVPPEMTGSSGREKTDACAGIGGAEGRLDEGEGAAARSAAVGPEGARSLTVVSAKASISSVEDCVT